MHAIIANKLNKVQIVAIFYLSFFFNAAAAQQIHYEFLGTIILSNQTIYSYKLVFSETKGKLNGYSISDIGGKHETKTKVEGLYNPSTGKISFAEKKVVYTQYNKSMANMCYISVAGKIQKKHGKLHLMADYTGTYEPSGKVCDKGKIILVSLRDLYSELAKVKTVLEKKGGKDSSTRSLLQSLNMLEKVEEVKEVNHQSVEPFNWKSNQLILELWDEAVDDKDRVSITINDSVAYPNQLVTKSRQRIIIPLKPNTQNKLKVTAIDEGQYAPNTIKLMCVDKEKRYLLLSQLNLNESFVIMLNTKGN